MINLDDVQDGIIEITRCRNRGFVGAMITIYRLDRAPTGLKVGAEVFDFQHNVIIRTGANHGSLSPILVFQIADYEDGRLSQLPESRVKGIP